MFEPYRISCLTCQTPLRVREASLIGQIVNCPKCHSMVQIVPPPGAEVQAGDVSPGETSPTAGRAETSRVQASPVPELASDQPAPPPIASEIAGGPGGLSADMASSTAPPIPTLPTAPQSDWQRWILLGAAGAVGVMFATSLWLFWKSKSRTEAPPTERPSVAVPSEPTPTHAVSDGAVAIGSSKETLPSDVSTSEVVEGVKESATPTQVTPTSDDTPDQPVVAARANTTDIREEDPLLLPLEEPRAASPAASSANPESAPPTSSRSDPIEQPIPAVHPDTAARLATRIDHVDFQGMGLGAAVSVLSQLSAVPVEWNEAVLRELGMDRRVKVDVNLDKATVGELLAQVLRSRGLAYVATENRVIIAHAETPPMRRVRYRVRDLAAGDRDLARLADMVATMIAPESWKPADGAATISYKDEALQVHQTARVHRQILLFCEQLRVARGLPPRSKRSDARTILVPARVQMAAALAAPLHLSTSDHPSLAVYLRRLEVQSDVAVSMDELALRKAGVSPQAAVTLTTDDQPLADLLSAAIEPLGLTYRAVDGSLLEVTTHRAIDQTPYVEFYHVDRLVPSPDDAASLLDRIEREIAPGRWTNSGGQGVLGYDAQSGYVIVRQTEPIHRQLREYLARP